MPVLTIAELKKSYRTPEGDVLNVVDVPAFSLEPGEQVALQGGSGSGKTTFLNLIAGILAADSGKVTVDGLEMSALSEAARDAARADRIGYIFQTFNLLPGYTALENVLLGMMFGPGPDTARAKELLERVGLKERMQYKPAQLSVGQQQRVAVARALASKPKLVLADEPTGNLDRKHAFEALELIRAVCKENGAALLLVSHDPEILGKFERVEKFLELNKAVQA
jgi:putative ABC transport system ATP-binding protein